VLQIFRPVVDDPVARAAPAPADIIIGDHTDRPTSIVAPNRNLQTTIPLNRKWRRRPAAAAPPSRLEQVALLGAAAADRLRLPARRLSRAREGSE